MAIYFIDILFIKNSRGMNNCGQRVLQKNIYFIMWFLLHFQLLHRKVIFLPIFWMKNQKD